MSNNYEIIPAGQPISKSGIQGLLDGIRPVWKGRNLIQRVNRLLPIDPSSACQRLFNAAIHDLKEKILNIGVDVANEAALKYRLPSINKEEDILEYNVSKTIDLAYRIGILKRPEWRRIHRCYEIRRDLEHEDDEYEAVLEDCFYIFKTTIDVVLSQDPIELLKVTDAKDLIESSSNISVSEEFLSDYNSAPKGRQKEISELLISFASDEGKPDIVRDNSVELLRHIKPITDKTVTIELASILEDKLGRSGINLMIAKIAYAYGALGYFKRVRLKDFFGKLQEDLKSTGSDWAKQKNVSAKLEDVGGLKNCPDELYKDVLRILAKIYIGERSYGPYSSSRPVFFSNGAAPIIARIIENEGEKARRCLEELRDERDLKRDLKDKYLLRRFENLVDLSCEIEEE
jgi:DNA-binding MltR family transcriptional regulator